MSLTTRKKQDREEGFTLIELLIVITVIGILGAIAIFAVGSFSGSATTACQDANTRIDQSAQAAADATKITTDKASDYKTPGTGTC